MAVLFEYQNPTADEFWNEISKKREPAILQKLDLGKASKLWTSDYLAETIGHVPVKLHVSPVSSMDFLKKNFLYKTLPFDEFIKRSTQDSQKDFFMSPVEKYYLRSIATANPRKGVADIEVDFPSIAGDIKFPSFVPKEKIFSSVFRIGSANLQLWTHYDVMDNILIQLTGKKRVTLFRPRDALNLYLNGDKSEVVDIDNPDLQKYPKFKNAIRYECILHPGDALFIPAMWFHNIITLDFSIGVNIFYKNLDEKFYDQKDIYGNKDLVPAARALQMVDKAVKMIDELPPDVRDFYSRVLVSRIENSLIKDNET